MDQVIQNSKVKTQKVLATALKVGDEVINGQGCVVEIETIKPTNPWGYELKYKNAGRCYCSPTATFQKIIH